MKVVTTPRGREVWKKNSNKQQRWLALDYLFQQQHLEAADETGIISNESANHSDRQGKLKESVMVGTRLPSPAAALASRQLSQPRHVQLL